MEHKGIPYQVAQTANPSGWKWTVQLPDNRTRTGSGFGRGHAVGLAERAIDKALRGKRAPEPEAAVEQ
jgi:hypothetical protein